MSLRQSFRLLILGCLTAAMAACASGPSITADHGTAEETVAQFLPAPPAARTAADRADPLTRADFWGREYAKTPEHLETTLSFISALEGIGSNERIVDVIRDTLPIHSRNVPLLVDLGQALNRLGQYDGSIGAYRSALQIDPGNVDAIAGQALAYDKSGRHETAQDLYVRALALDPSRTTTRTNYGLSLALTGDIENAEAQLRLASEAHDASPRVRQNLALIQGLRGDFVSARETASIDMPRELVAENIETLQGVLGTSRSYEALEALDGDAAETDAPAPTRRRTLRGL